MLSGSVRENTFICRIYDNDVINIFFEYLFSYIKIKTILLPITLMTGTIWITELLLHGNQNNINNNESY